MSYQITQQETLESLWSSVDKTHNVPGHELIERNQVDETDASAWKNCIKTKDAARIGDLLRRKKIPNNDLLNEAYSTFDMEYVQNICDGICQYILQLSKETLHVYPAISIDKLSDRPQAPITFVVILGKRTNIYHEFKLHIKYTDEFASDIQRCEVEMGLLDDDRITQLSNLKICLREHSQSLMKNHTNVCRISCSGFKSARFSKADESMKQSYCISIYVYAKGFIPLGEEKLPETLHIDGYDAQVDVREGFVELFGGNEGPYNSLKHLRMGCSIGGHPHSNKNLHGTLGGFFEFGGADLCLSTAHVFLTAREMERHKSKERQSLETDKATKYVYQPHDVYHNPFGKARMAVYIEGENGKTGVDALSILIENRKPKSGEFARSDKDTSPGKTYSTGKVYKRDDIHGLLKKKNRRVLKYGCRTGWTTGTLRLNEAVFRAPHPVQDGDTLFNVRLHNQFEVQSDTENDFATKSDSGALVFMEDNEELVAIGMVVAGMANEVCFVTPLDEILKALGLDPEDGLKRFESEANSEVPDDLDVFHQNRHASSGNEELISLRTDLNQMKSDNVSINDRMTAMENDVKSGMDKMDKMDKNMQSGFDNIMAELQKRQGTNQ